MEVLYPRCCGLDVHKSSIAACALLREQGRIRTERRRFTTMTQDLQELAAWLRQLQVTHVAIESTGVYWKPVWNILEGHFTIILANAQHVKNVPGRKTDAKDSEWIAELVQHGLLRSSYVPPEIIRDLRDLTRGRATLSQEASRIASRIQKVLEDANIKLSSVASNTLGTLVLFGSRALIQVACEWLVRHPIAFHHSAFTFHKSSHARKKKIA
jgi:transposase